MRHPILKQIQILCDLINLLVLLLIIVEWLSRLRNRVLFKENKAIFFITTPDRGDGPGPTPLCPWVFKNVRLSPPDNEKIFGDGPTKKYVKSAAGGDFLRFHTFWTWR